MKTAVVTGANGFIGSALLHELVNHDIKVYAVVKDEDAQIDSICNLRNVEIVCCEMDQIGELPQKFEETPDVFFHLAWAGSTGELRADYALQLTNTRWTLDAVNAAKAIGCKRFVGAGTLAEYDVNSYTPFDGSTPNAVSNYGVAKIAAHYMSKAECNRLGIDHLWAYLSNTYGEGNYTNNFVNFAAKMMLKGQEANFTAGEQIYDFVHISDTVRGLYCIAERGRKNNAYYIGSTKPEQLKEFIKKIRNAIDPGIPINLGAIPFNGVSQPKSTFDCTKLVQDTGYWAEVPFESGIIDTVEWLRQQLQEDES